MPIGNAIITVNNNKLSIPAIAVSIPAFSGCLDGRLLKKPQFNLPNPRQKISASNTNNISNAKTVRLNAVMRKILSFVFDMAKYLSIIHTGFEISYAARNLHCLR